MINRIIKPMLCQPTDHPFSNQDYLVEIKFDGERAILFWDGTSIRIQNRRGDDVTFRYPELQGIKEGLKCENGIFDGEIVCFDAKGKSKFGLIAQRSHLQNKFDIELRMKRIPVSFVAFDCLYVNGNDITKYTLHQRKDVLLNSFITMPPLSVWSLALDREGNGIRLFKEAKFIGLEGIVIKHANSPYQEGKRSPYWKKIKCIESTEMLFDSYTINPAGVRVVNKEGIAVQVGGRDWKLVKQLIDAKGSVMVEVEYLNRTENGRLRQPVYKGVR